MSSLRLAARLAVADWLHDGWVTVCAVLSLSAVMSPLLLVMGVKHGVVESLTNRMVAHPRYREVVPVKAGHFDSELVEKLRMAPGVTFLSPQTRSIAAICELSSPEDRNHRIAVDMLATGPGDPLLPDASPGDSPGHIVLAEGISRKLGARPGQDLICRITRFSGNAKESLEMKMTVESVIPEGLLTREAVLVSLPFLTATEDYRDGIETVPDKAESVPGPRTYASVRLYAATLKDVAVVRDTMAGLGIDTFTHAEEIETVMALERAMNSIFGMLALVAGLGGLASQAANVHAATMRKMRWLGITKLLGFCSAEVLLFPVLQAFLTWAAGVCVSLVLFLAGQGMINHLFASYVQAGERVCSLSLDLAIFFLGVTLLMMIVTALAVGWKVKGVQPAEVIRDV